MTKTKKQARRERQNRETAVLDHARQHCEDKLNVESTKSMKLDAALGVTCPTIQAAVTLRVLLHPSHDLGALVTALDRQVKAVNGGDLKQVEGMLLTQAHTLSELFNGLVRRATNQQLLRPYETYLRLALKAQSQCRTTLETLAFMKNPPNVAFVRQANISGGHQQINNGSPSESGARENEIPQTKLSETLNELLPHARTSPPTGRTDSRLEAVGAINRAEIGTG